ncbi:C2 calcium/lipid-binding domain-containing protein CaLB [Tanacetum coccineum]
MEYDPSNLVFAKWLPSKVYNHLDIDWYTKNTLWIYLARGDDEVEPSDEESSDPDDENLIDKDEVAKIFRIETNNIRMTGYMSRKKTYHGYMKNHRQKMKYGRNPLLLNIVVSHSYSRVDILKWPTCSWKDDGYCNGGNLPGAFKVGNTLGYQDLEWYEALEDGKLKEESLLNKAIMDGTINEEEESLDKTWKK